jgi:hypothetical protein
MEQCEAAFNLYKLLRQYKLAQAAEARLLHVRVVFFFQYRRKYVSAILSPSISRWNGSLPSKDGIAASA